LYLGCDRIAQSCMCCSSAAQCREEATGGGARSERVEGRAPKQGAAELIPNQAVSRARLIGDKPCQAMAKHRDRRGWERHMVLYGRSGVIVEPNAVG
jgi:hypothetical protein